MFSSAIFMFWCNSASLILYLQLPPWQHWCWRRASFGACAQRSPTIRRTASTGCGSTATNTMMKFISTPWAPKSPCSPTSFRMKAKAMKRHCMRTKSERFALVWFSIFAFFFVFCSRVKSLRISMNSSYHSFTVSLSEWMM